MSDCVVCRQPTPQGRAFCSTHWGLLDPQLQREFTAVTKAYSRARAAMRHYEDADGLGLAAAKLAYRTCRAKCATDIRMAMQVGDQLREVK